MILQGLCNLHHLGLGFQERAVIVQVLYDGIEVYFKNGLMYLLLQLFRDLIEAKRTRTFQQNQFIAQALEDIAGKEMLHIGKEVLLVDANLISLCRKFRTNTDELLHTALHAEVTDLGIKCLGQSTGLVHITQDKCRFEGNVPALHKVESDIEGVDIRVVGVVDEDAATLTFLYLQAHGHWLQLRHALGQLLCGET